MVDYATSFGKGIVCIDQIELSRRDLRLPLCGAKVFCEGNF